MKIRITYSVNGVPGVSEEAQNNDYELDIEESKERLRVVIRAKHPITLEDAVIEDEFSYEKIEQVLVNGYQSWTDTREFALSEHEHDLMRRNPLFAKIFHLDAYGDAHFLEYDRDVLHSFTYSYARDKEGNAFFAGSLNEENAYLIIRHRHKENKIEYRSDCANKAVEDSFTLFDIVRYRGAADEVQKRYFESFGKCAIPSVRGYTSWYDHYQNINEQKMVSALNGVDEKEFDLFQIDDGYETFVGDWLLVDKKKFPEGLEPMVERIHKKGLKAGIWLAPFVCEKNSRIYKDRHEWVYTENGKDIYSGNNWSSHVPLDIRKEEVLAYIRKCLEHYMDMGFDLFKLDFLYAAALVRDMTGKTRAEMMRDAMKFLRDVLKDRLILGCGVPLSSAFNLVDYCRIGPDVSLKFDDVFYMRQMHRERISTKTTIQNTLFRTFMDGHVFRCDPDVFMLRDENNSLSAEQKEALTILNHLCGAVYMTSDDVSAYDEKKRAVLEKARTLNEAKVCDVKRDADIITIKYILDNEKKTMRYDRKKGMLI